MSTNRRRGTRASGGNVPPAGLGHQRGPPTRGRGAGQRVQHPQPGQHAQPEQHVATGSYGGQPALMVHTPAYPGGHYPAPAPVFYPQQGSSDPRLQNVPFEQYEDDEEYEQEDFGEGLPRGGLDNDQWSLSIFQPNIADDTTDALNERTAPTGTDPDQAPLRRVTRGAEPAITNTEFRNLVPSTETSVAFAIGADATRPPQAHTETVTLTAPTTPVRRTEASHVALAYSPYKRVLNPNDKSKPRLQDLSPPSTKLAQEAGARYRKYIVTQKGFPTNKERDTTVSQAVADSSVGIEKGERRLLRYKAEKDYQGDVDKVIRRLGTQVRGSLVKFCRDNSGMAFKLIGLPKAKIIIIVTELLDVKAYHFRELKRETEIIDGVEVEKIDGKIIDRLGAYRHLMIEQSIRKEYFQDHERMATNDTAENSFNPVPNEVIAMAATAIHCALDEWRTGVHLIGDCEFKEKIYRPTYQAHLAALEAMSTAAPAANRAWRAYLFQRCSTGLLNNHATGDAPAVTLTRSELTDYSDIPNTV